MAAGIDIWALCAQQQQFFTDGNGKNLDNLRILNGLIRTNTAGITIGSGAPLPQVTISTVFNYEGTQVLSVADRNRLSA